MRMPREHTVVLVEGESDRLALEVVARRLGIGLDPRLVRIESLAGITNLRHRLTQFTRDGEHVRPRILGLYDAAERAYVGRVLADLGFVQPDSPGDELRAAGFFAADRDLEDEVIRAAGADLVLAVLEQTGDGSRFRVFQGQPAQRDRPVHAQLHRFAGTAAGRKARFAADILAAMPAGSIPEPLVGLLRRAVSDRAETLEAY